MRSSRIFKVLSVIYCLVFVLSLVLSADLMAKDKKSKGKKGPNILNKYKDLNLTADQKKKIESSKEGKAKAEIDKKWKAIKDKKGPEAAKLKDERKKIGKAFDKMMGKILTKDQKAKLKEAKLKSKNKRSKSKK